MSKEEILNSRWVALNKKESDPEMHLYLSEDQMEMIGEAMDEYAKEVAIGFIEYRDIFKREEGRQAQREYKKAGGIFSWIGRSDEEIYDDYINRKPIESFLAPEGIKSYWSYNEKGKLVHSSK